MVASSSFSLSAAILPTTSSVLFVFYCSIVLLLLLPDQIRSVNGIVSTSNLDLSQYERQ